MDDATAKTCTELAITELVLIGITTILGFIGWWQAFAGMAFLCVMMPLWGIVAILVCMVDQMERYENEKG